jgi:hypothetical protein
VITATCEGGSVRSADDNLKATTIGSMYPKLFTTIERLTWPPYLMNSALAMLTASAGPDALT